MNRRLSELHVENFRSLREVTLPLNPVNVLVGPNGAGKTNVLEVFRFLADMAAKDMEPAFKERDGYWDVVSWGDEPSVEMRIGLKGTWTSFSSQDALDEYNLELRPMANQILHRTTFRFKRFERSGRRITLSAPGAFPSGRLIEESPESVLAKGTLLTEGVSETTSIDGQVGPAEFTDRLASLRHVGVDADLGHSVAAVLALRADESAWQHLVEDARHALPHLADIVVEDLPGGEVGVVLHEWNLRHPTPLDKASHGTVRLLGLLALLHDPEPPVLTCIENIDTGIHPQALELLVERIREASDRTQFLITTHSPALVDRLRPEELVVCERGNDGASIIPALSTYQVKAIVAEAQRAPLGELWLSGALGGDL